MKSLNLFTFLLLGFLVVFSSCSDDEVEPDLRENIVGNYMGMATMNTGFSTENTMSSISVTKDSNDKSRVLVNFDGVNLYANDISEVSNGYVFNFPSQRVTVDGRSLTFSGNNGFEVSGAFYHGVFNKDDKRLQFEAMISSSESDVFVSVSAGKR